jgi:hypothetical protein
MTIASGLQGGKIHCYDDITVFQLFIPNVCWCCRVDDNIYKVSGEPMKKVLTRVFFDFSARSEGTAGP